MFKNSLSLSNVHILAVQHIINPMSLTGEEQKGGNWRTIISNANLGMWIPTCQFASSDLKWSKKR